MCGGTNTLPRSDTCWDPAVCAKCLRGERGGPRLVLQTIPEPLPFPRTRKGTVGGLREEDGLRKKKVGAG